MACHEREQDGGLFVGIEIGPVHGDLDGGAGAGDLADPMGEDGVEVDPWVGQQPVHLFDGVLCFQPARDRQPLSDGVHREGTGAHDAERGVRQGQDAFGMHVGAEQPFQERLDVFESQGLIWRHRLPRVSGYARFESRRTAGRKRGRDERKIWNPVRPPWIFFRIPNG